VIYWNSPNLPLQNFLCLDLGTKKTGIAHNFQINSIATPHKTVETIKVLEEIITLQKNNFSYVIVGIPMAYPESESHQFIENFVNYLQEQLPEMNFIFWDETNTSQMVREQHKHGRKGFSKKFHKNYDSKVAALILSSFLV
jgi:putative transcription antitermination factor YqgF